MEKLFTQEELDNAVAKTIHEQQEIARKDMLVRNAFDRYSYTLSQIRNNKDVRKHKNVLAMDYHLKEFIELVNEIGFEKFNELVVSEIVKEEETELQKKHEKEVILILGDEV